MLDYFTDKIDLKNALVYSALLALGTFVAGICHHIYFYYMNLFGMRLRISCVGLVYREVKNKK
jgi:hypothetical protein